MSEEFEQDQWDEATARRLRRLDGLPVDTTRLEKSVGWQIPARGRLGQWSWRGWSRSLRAAAASLLVGMVLAGVLLLSTLSGPVQASAMQMAKVHEDLVSGKVPVTQVDSIEAAGRALSSQWPQAPDLPDLPQAPQTPDVPREHVMACCMKSVKNKQMACVLLKKEGVPITMAVANAADVTGTHGTKVQRAGMICYVQAVGNLNMVMTQRQGRWVCLMGQVSDEQLIDLAAHLQF